MENLSEKHNVPISQVQTKLLFHGTSGTDPKLIYDSEEGLDMRFSKNGMWGVGIYFAVNSEYSNSYAFRAPQNER